MKTTLKAGAKCPTCKKGKVQPGDLDAPQTGRPCLTCAKCGASYPTTLKGKGQAHG